MATKAYKYVYGRGRESYNLPESDIRYAMANTKSNAEAARFSKVSFSTWKKYANMYYLLLFPNILLIRICP